MKFTKSFAVCASVIALSVAALPVASSAQQQPAPEAPAVQAAPAPAVAAAPEGPSAAQLQLISDAADLSPGGFIWRPELATGGDIEMVVSIPQQRAYIYRGRTLIGVTTVSTGMAGHRTPTGRYPIMEKRRTHFSNLYNNAPMPFMQRLTMGGIALHAGVIPGYPASHGCVRLPYAFAQHLFGATRVRSMVHIVNTSPSAENALAMARGEYNGQLAMGTQNLVRGTR